MTTTELLDKMKAETSRLSLFILRKEHQDLIAALRVAVETLERSGYHDEMVSIDEILRGEE